MPVYYGNGDKRGQAFELSGDEGSVGPWARIGNIQMVAAGLRRKTGALLGGDKVSELRRKSLVSTVFARELENVDFLEVSGDCVTNGGATYFRHEDCLNV